jgi:hypothetical protein
MDRTLRVTIDRTTWPKPGPPVYPSTFGASPASCTINIPALLLTIGYLTTPSHSSGVSLSEFWAWVRYLHAISGDADLRLTTAFHELDSHQKTILSDDFGMGLPIYWLLGKLDVATVADGRYFAQRLASSAGASAVKAKKRGPGKSPDFVANYTSGLWHVIECKGTQTSSAYRALQLGTAGSNPTGAVAQKRTINFPIGYTGQRLASGLFIGVEGGAHTSGLHVIDPPGDEEASVPDDRMAFADDAIARAAGARALRLAGFSATSSALSAPLGRSPDAAPGKGRYEDARLQVVARKRAQAAEELATRGIRPLFRVDGDSFRGRKVEIALPVPVHIGTRTASSVVIRYGVGTRFLEELRSNPIIDEPIQEVLPAFDQIQRGTKLEGDEGSARMRIGRSFVADIEFR